MCTIHLCSVHTAHCFYEHSMWPSHHIWHHQIYVEVWISEATQYNSGSGSRVHQYRCIYLVSPHLLLNIFLCHWFLCLLSTVSIIVGIMVCLESVHCMVTGWQAQYLVQGNNYWVAAAGIVISRCKYHLSNDRLCCADLLLGVGYVNSMLAV